MKAVLRALLAIALGLVVAFALIVAVEWLSSIVHPLPPNFDGNIAEHVRRYPDWVLAVVVLVWGATGAGATWVAARVGSRVAGGVVGVLLLAALVLNLSMLPYPPWFEVVMPAVLAAACLAGTWCGSRRTVAGSAAPAAGQDRNLRR